MKSLINDNEAIYCKTQEEWDKVLNLLQKNNEKWGGGDGLNRVGKDYLYYDFNKHWALCKLDGRIWRTTLTDSRLKYIPGSYFLASNGVEVKSIEEKIREVLERHIYDNDGINLAIPELTELFNTHS